MTAGAYLSATFLYSIPTYGHMVTVMSLTLPESLLEIGTLSFSAEGRSRPWGLRVAKD